MVDILSDWVAIGRRIAEAREAQELTQTELATALGLDRTAISRIEAGTRKVSATELVSLAAELDRPIDWFVSESPPAVVSRRQDPAAGGRSKIMDLRIEQLARDVEFLQAGGVLPQVRAADRMDLAVPTNLSEAESAAERVRTALDISDGPLLGLQRQCERLGLLAFSLELGPTGGDAAYVALSTLGVALINGSIEPGRRRFNLAHELAHHVVADEYAPEVAVSTRGDTERLLNAFAIHLMMPRQSVAELWREFAPDDYRLGAVAVAVRYRMSWSAVSAQLCNLDLIDGAQRQLLLAQPPTGADFIALGESWVPELAPPAVPPEYGRKVLAAYRAGKLTSARTVELLWGTVAEQDLPAQHEIPHDGLRRDFDRLP